MRSITPSTALAQIASGDLAPVYLVLGDDALEKAEMADAFEQAQQRGDASVAVGGQLVDRPILLRALSILKARET